MGNSAPGVKRHTVMRKILAVAVPAILLAAVAVSCGQGRVMVQGETNATDLPSQVSAAAANTNKTKAQAEAKRLLDSVVIPPGSVMLTGGPSVLLPGPVMGLPGASSLIDDTRFWKVPMSMSAALAWFADHPPGGLRQSGSGSTSSHGTVVTSGLGYDAPSSAAWTDASVEIGVAPTGSGLSVVRADGIALWIDPVPVRDSQPGSRVRITSSSGCLPSDRGFVGVTNPPPPLDSSLLPSGSPSGGLVCKYYGLNGQAFALEQSTAMDSGAASAFSASVGRLELGHIDGRVGSCPADDASAIVVALVYPDGRTVDLWMATAGCARISNGYISASGTVPV